MKDRIKNLTNKNLLTEEQLPASALLARLSLRSKAVLHTDLLALPRVHWALPRPGHRQRVQMFARRV